MIRRAAPNHAEIGVGRSEIEVGSAAISYVRWFCVTVGTGVSQKQAKP